MKILSTASVSINDAEVNRLVQVLKISSDTDAHTIVFVDDKNYILTLGVTYPMHFAQLRYRRRFGKGSIKGPVVRINSQVQRKRRSDQSMNQVLVHELEHVAQLDRHDQNRLIGHTLMVTLAIGGLGLAYCLGAGLASWRPMVAMLAGIIGHRLGYQLAPHERQARKRAQALTTTAVSSKP